MEFGDILLENTENVDVLILSGDIMVAQDLHDHPESSTPAAPNTLGKRQSSASRYRGFFDRISKEFPQTVYCAGNHEFYHGKFHASIDYLRDECARYPNISFLEQDTKIIDDVVFIGATVWTDCNTMDPITMHSVGLQMNDYHVIRNDQAGYTKLRPAHTISRHRKTISYFKEQLELHKDKKCVIVGHHMPHDRSTPEQYKSDHIMNGAYRSDLSGFILDHPQIALWTCGHTHERHRYYIGDTLVSCNPRGYIGYESKADAFMLKSIDLDAMPTTDTVAKDYHWDY